MKLAEARAAQGLSMTALANQAEVSRTSIHRIEGGESLASPERASKIADALGVVIDDIEELMEGIKKYDEAHCPLCTQLREVIKAALDRRGINWKEACRQAGLSLLTITVLAGIRVRGGTIPCRMPYRS